MRTCLRDIGETRAENVHGNSEGTLENSSSIVIERILSLVELCTRASDANSANKGTALVKTPKVFTRVSKRDTLRTSENRIFTCEERAREERQEEEVPLHRLLENPAIHTCVQGRPSKT